MMDSEIAQGQLGECVSAMGHKGVADLFLCFRSERFFAPEMSIFPLVVSR